MSAELCRNMSAVLVTSAAPASGSPPLALGLPPLAVAYRRDPGAGSTDPYILRVACGCEGCTSDRRERRVCCRRWIVGGHQHIIGHRRRHLRCRCCGAGRPGVSRWHRHCRQVVNCHRRHLACGQCGVRGRRSTHYTMLHACADVILGTPEMAVQHMCVRGSGGYVCAALRAVRPRLLHRLQARRH